MIHIEKQKDNTVQLQLNGKTSELCTDTVMILLAMKEKIGPEAFLAMLTLSIMDKMEDHDHTVIDLSKLKEAKDENNPRTDS